MNSSPTTLPKVLESHTTVRFQDCDPFQHLNNAKYIDYFINAREDQLAKTYNISGYEYAQKNGAGWLVAQNQIAYFRPAVMMETVVIQSQLIRFSNRSLMVEMRMFDQEKKELKALMWATFVLFDFKTKKSTQHSPEFMELFEGINEPVASSVFEERVAEMRAKK